MDIQFNDDSLLEINNRKFLYKLVNDYKYFCFVKIGIMVFIHTFAYS